VADLIVSVGKQLKEITEEQRKKERFLLGMYERFYKLGLGSRTQ
jgi:hypothetical protein